MDSSPGSPSPCPFGLDAIRDCLDGAIPGVVATCDEEGVPNVAYLSQCEYIDSEHLALSFQFFNKTRRNILANPRAQIIVTRPTTGAIFRIDVRYLRTETSGPLFENMRAKLAGIASHTGMSGVFKLLGSDVYRVVHVEMASPGNPGVIEAPRRALLAALRRAQARLAQAGDLDALLHALVQGLEHEFGFPHSKILLFDEAAGRLYTVASHGYGSSGAGSEIAMGHGVIGMAAQEKTAIRIGHFTAEYTYSQAIRAGVQAHGDAASLERAIPLPGLTRPGSQLAAPVVVDGRVLGVVFVEHEQEMSFGFDEEDALVCLMAPLGMSIQRFLAPVSDLDAAAGDVAGPLAASSADSARLAGAVVPAPAAAAELQDGMAAAASPVVPAGHPVRVRYFEADSSVFLDNDYLIKGVAGAVLWKLVRDYVEGGRVDFSNRELRLARDIRLPDVSDNLEARLVLLARRLIDRQAAVQIEKTGRGRHRLCVQRPLHLETIR